ncbi:MAG: hypothetical protein IJ193_00320 [Bacilli bacterium]|nr:hypothetical protein [Bacilli bacterium]
MKNNIDSHFNLMLEEIKNKHKFHHEANNYIDVPKQLKYEVERFKRSLQNNVPEANENIINKNTENNSEAFYLGMEQLYKLSIVSNPNIIDIYKHVSTSYLNQFQIDLLKEIMFTIFVILLFPSIRKDRINNIKKLIIDFMNSIDVRKYDV